MADQELRVLIVAEHASARFGGEAALPLHYFRVLRQRGINAWLVVHERTRQELEDLFPHDRERIYFVPDTVWHRLVWQVAKRLPQRLSYFTFGFVLRVMTQLIQRRLIQRVIREHRPQVIHQPMPVSPKEPSMLFGLGVPVVIGPMNGGMNYPPAFQHLQSRFVNVSLGAGRWFANFLNTVIPGKRQAATLLVANDRTRKALPDGIRGRVEELVENGVDLSIWRPTGAPANPDPNQPVRFVFVGRLVDWKAVDLLLIAFQRVVQEVPARLEIIGDGSERGHLEQLAEDLKLGDRVQFVGWLAQADCATRLQQAAVMVLPSLLECGGAVVLEAMAMGVPVIATNWGGPADYLDQTCGVLVEPTSREEFIAGLAAAMVRLANSAELRSAMGQAGRQRVLAQFDWEVKVDRMVEIYRSLLRPSEQPDAVSESGMVDGVMG